MGHYVPFNKGTENILEKNGGWDEKITRTMVRRSHSGMKGRISHVWERLVRAPGGGGEGGKELKCTDPTHEKRNPLRLDTQVTPH